MKRKLTAVLSLATLLAITPVSSGFAQSNAGTGNKAPDANPGTVIEARSSQSGSAGENAAPSHMKPTGDGAKA